MTESHAGRFELKPALSAVLLFILLVLVGFGIRGIKYDSMLASDRINFNGQVLPTTPDAYFFLSEIRDWVRGEYNSAKPLRSVRRGENPSLLVKAVGAVSRLTDINLLNLAIWVPAIAAAVGMAFLFTAYGLELDNYFIVFCAGALATLPVDWYLRSGLGYFDTDCLNVPLFYSVVFCLYKSCFFQRRIQGLLFVAGALLSSLLLVYWWKEAGHILVAGLWSCWLLVPSNNKFINIGKVAIVVSGLITVGAYFTGYVELVPDIVSHVFDFSSNYLRAAALNNNIFFDPFETVGELSTFGALDTFSRFCGHWLVFVPCLVGSVLFIRRYRLSGAVLVVPGMLFFILSFFMGVRFLIFATPMFGFGIAYLSFALCSKMTAPGWGIKISSIVLCAVLAIPVFSKANSYGYSSMLSKYGANLATIVDRFTGKNARVWCWWSEGYFVQYFSRRWTIIDGGLQTPLRSFITSLPLATTNYKFAARWIKLFAARSDAIETISRYTQDTEKSVQFLIKALSGDYLLKSLCAEYGLPLGRNWKKWLFPEIEVYLYLTPDLLLRNSWLTSGMMIKSSEDRIPIYAFPLKDLVINKKKGIAYFKNIEYRYSKAFFVTNKSLSHDNIRKSGPILIAIKGSNSFYMVSEATFKSLALQLLFVHPTSLKGYTPLVYHPYVGGVWRVE